MPTTWKLKARVLGVQQRVLRRRNTGTSEGQAPQSAGKSEGGRPRSHDAVMNEGPPPSRSSNKSKKSRKSFWSRGSTPDKSAQAVVVEQGTSGGGSTETVEIETVVQQQTTTTTTTQQVTTGTNDEGGLLGIGIGMGLGFDDVQEKAEEEEEEEEDDDDDDDFDFETDALESKREVGGQLFLDAAHSDDPSSTAFPTSTALHPAPAPALPHPHPHPHPHPPSPSPSPSPPPAPLRPRTPQLLIPLPPRPSDPTDELLPLPSPPIQTPEPVERPAGRFVFTHPSPSPPRPAPHTPSTPSLGRGQRPPRIVRRQSLLPEAPSTSTVISTLLTENQTPLPQGSPASHYRPEHIEFPLPQYPPRGPNPAGFSMVNRRIWVRRPNGAPTMVTVGDEDLVDEVKDAVVRKYQIALGKSYDAPDLHLRIVPRGSGSRPRSLDHPRTHAHQALERMLLPEESIARTLDEYFPGGQAASEALIVEVPQRRTPRPSPNPVHYVYSNEPHIVEPSDYFSAMPISSSHGHGTPGGTQNPQQPSMATLAAVQGQPLPGSPGAGGRVRSNMRPAMRPRMPTQSPTLHGHGHTPQGGQGGIVLQPRGNRSRAGSDGAHSGQPPLVPSQQNASEEATEKVPTPPVQPHQHPRHAGKNLPNRKGGINMTGDSDQNVPPIKVLIVEDNMINLKLLEAFMKRLKVRWESAVNGKIAVDKWRAGGFHLVLMDIQLPVMNGLDATKEIRRLERVNKIGAFPHIRNDIENENGNGNVEDITEEEVVEADKLPDSILFRSPVIIVALTASSLQNDRHEAYAAGCNDFLTKPVNLMWLERKVMEWGCMQALIDFDGWKAWKVTAQKAPAEGKKKFKGRKKAMAAPPAPTPAPVAPEKELTNGDSQETLRTNDKDGEDHEDRLSSPEDMMPNQRKEISVFEEDGDLQESLEDADAEG